MDHPGRFPRVTSLQFKKIKIIQSIQPGFYQLFVYTPATATGLYAKSG